MDECLSVLEHFQSSVMREVNENMDTLTSGLMRAGHVYYIDANVDSSMMADAVSWLGENEEREGVLDTQHLCEGDESQSLHNERYGPANQDLASYGSFIEREACGMPM